MYLSYSRIENVTMFDTFIRCRWLNLNISLILLLINKWYLYLILEFKYYHIWYYCKTQMTQPNMLLVLLHINKWYLYLILKLKCYVIWYYYLTHTIIKLIIYMEIIFLSYIKMLSYLKLLFSCYDSDRAYIWFLLYINK